MQKHFELADNATVTRWNAGGQFGDVLFPEQKIELGGAQKLRGGAPVCSPIFGDMPNTPDYAGFTIPKHGLMRTGAGHVTRFRHTKKDGTDSLTITYDHPWPHQVEVTAHASPSGDTLTHTITATDRGTDKVPLSIGFHPYFATHNKAFTIINGDTEILSSAIETDKPFFIECTESKKIILKLTDGYIMEITLNAGYERCCIWTDAIEHYICIEPVMGGDGHYRFLYPGDAPLVCACTLRVY
jgi:galactose mutarotase-like enzyme